MTDIQNSDDLNELSLEQQWAQVAEFIGNPHSETVTVDLSVSEIILIALCFEEERVLALEFPDQFRSIQQKFKSAVAAKHDVLDADFIS